MKTLIIASVLLTSSLAFASKDDHWIRYQCQARGSKAGTTKLIQGWERNTVSQAQTSAVQVCRQRGYSGCYVAACYERVH